MLFVSGGSMLPEAAEFFYVAGCIAGALGAGFLVSAVAAYVLSSRLGLLERPARRARPPKTMRDLTITDIERLRAEEC